MPIKIKKEYEQYYINWSRITGNYLVFRVGQLDCLKVCKTKQEAEQLIKLLNK